MLVEFRLPDIGEGVAEGEVVRWFVKEGDSIREDQPLVGVLTDKANVEIPSPKTGRIAKIHAAVGEKVKVGGLLVSFEVSGDAAPAATSAAAPVTSAPSAPAAPAAATPRPTAPASGPSAPGSSAALASPFVRRLAAEKGIDLATVKGTGPGGRITEADVGGSPPSASTRSASGAVAPAPAGVPAPSAAAASAPASPAVPDSEVAERVPIRGLRRVIAEHMSESMHRAAHFTYVEEIDASELVRFRDRMAKHVEKQ
ncbi:MAG TPA: biotin/lipoyl-containing protein, partial [Thermoplasmata archaeon]|nr:biotin/lipoyl-containing protein [Thermoplasmata archaeon]